MRPTHLLGEGGRAACCGKTTAELGMGARLTDDAEGVTCSSYQPPELEEYVPSEPSPGWPETDLKPLLDAVDENVKVLAEATAVHFHGPEEPCSDWCGQIGFIGPADGLKFREGDQQLPVPNDEPDIQSQVIADIEERRQVGIQRYGTALQPFNGRDAARDLYEELLDGAMYAKQLLVERARLLARIAELEAERDILLAEIVAH